MPESSAQAARTVISSWTQIQIVGIAGAGLGDKGDAASRNYQYENPNLLFVTCDYILSSAGFEKEQTRLCFLSSFNSAGVIIMNMGVLALRCISDGGHHIQYYMRAL